MSDEHAERHPAATCMQLITAYQVSRAIHAALALGVFDRLKVPATSEALAEATASHPDSLYRLLRALAGAGVLHEEKDHLFALTPVGAYLRTDAPHSLAAWARSMGQPYYWAAWGDLHYSIQSGDAAFPHVHGMDVWEYRSRHADDAEHFNQAMTAMSKRTSKRIVMSHDFRRFACVVDVGGGRGALLTELLRRHPAQRGVLFDLPEALVDVEEELRPTGVSDRIQCIRGSFFETIPGGGDAYVMCSVLHNWQDEQAVAILESCRRAMRGDARLLVAENEIGAPNGEPEIKFLDLNMLVIHGARERTRTELADLFGAAGLELVDVTRMPTGMSVLECRVRDRGTGEST